MAGMFVNLRKKPGLVTACYIIDLKWLPQTNCIDGKNVWSIFYGERELGMKQINIDAHKLNLYPADIRGSSVCVRLIQLCLFTMLITQAAQRLGG